MVVVLGGVLIVGRDPGGHLLRLVTGPWGRDRAPALPSPKAFLRTVARVSAIFLILTHAEFCPPAIRVPCHGAGLDFWRGDPR